MDFGRIIEYPSKYFNQNNKQKPSVSLPYKDVDLDTLRPFVVKSIKDDSISSDLAALFLWKFGERFKATLTEKWESFGVTICEPGEVKLSSIINIHFGTEEIPSLHEKDGMVSSNDDDWIASFLTSFYRINGASSVEYRSQLSKSALDVLNKNCRKGSNTSLNLTNILLSISPSFNDYCKIIAAYDMFLFKTKIKKYQFLRWGTITSRHRDCSILSTWIDISNECGYKNVNDLKEWVFVDIIAQDVNRILKDGEEIDKPDSYMPYLADLKLSAGSPYTCRNNPALHLFLTTIKFYLGQKGSSNVKMPECIPYQVCYNGLIVAYVLRKKYCSANKNQSTDNPGARFESDPVLEAISTSDELLAFIKNKPACDVINGPFGKFKKSIDETIINPKPGTVGAFLTHSLNF